MRSATRIYVDLREPVVERDGIEPEAEACMAEYADNGDMSVSGHMMDKATPDSEGGIG